MINWLETAGRFAMIMIKEWLQAAPQNRSVTVRRFMEEEWEAVMTALRDLHVTANRLCGEAAQDKADYEIIYL
jgi:hypothetical protein